MCSELNIKPFEFLLNEIVYLVLNQSLDSSQSPAGYIAGVVLRHKSSRPWVGAPTALTASDGIDFDSHQGNTKLQANAMIEPITVSMARSVGN